MHVTAVIGKYLHGLDEAAIVQGRVKDRRGINELVDPSTASRLWAAIHDVWKVGREHGVVYGDLVVVCGCVEVRDEEDVGKGCSCRVVIWG